MELPAWSGGSRRQGWQDRFFLHDVGISSTEPSKIHRLILFYFRQFFFKMPFCKTRSLSFMLPFRADPDERYPQITVPNMRSLATTTRIRVKSLVNME